MLRRLPQAALWRWPRFEFLVFCVCDIDLTLLWHRGRALLGYSLCTARANRPLVSCCYYWGSRQAAGRRLGHSVLRRGARDSLSRRFTYLRTHRQADDVTYFFRWRIPSRCLRRWPGIGQSSARILLGILFRLPSRSSVNECREMRRADVVEEESKEKH